MLYRRYVEVTGVQGQVDLVY